MCHVVCVCVHACGCVCDGGLRGGNRWGLRADVRSALLCGCGCVALLWGIIMRLALLALCGRHLGSSWAHVPVVAAVVMGGWRSHAPPHGSM